MLFRPTGNRLVESVGLWLGSPKRTLEMPSLSPRKIVDGFNFFIMKIPSQVVCCFLNN